MHASNPPRVLLGLTGGVAAYKAAELCRLLIKRGADVRVVMTAAAAQFITPVTMQALSGQAVASDLWDRAIDNAMGHIELAAPVSLIWYYRSVPSRPGLLLYLAIVVPRSIL